MLFSILSSGDILTVLLEVLFTLPIVLFALCAHETAHGYVAWKMGDPTAYNLGRLTLNPLKHLDPVGFLCMVVFGFGWAKPVPINVRNFKNPKYGMALSGAAGPICNFLIGLCNAVIAGFLYAFLLTEYDVLPYSVLNILYYFYIFFYLGVEINFLYAVFNLLPVPPFDGSRIVHVFLPAKWYFGIMKYEKYILYGVLGILFLLSRLGIYPSSIISGWLSDKCISLFEKLFSLILS